jgi:hypothetical protein
MTAHHHSRRSGRKFRPVQWEDVPARNATSVEPSAAARRLVYMPVIGIILCVALSTACTVRSGLDAAKARGSAICDGSRSLKLRIFVSSNPGSHLRGSAVRIEHGIPSFGLDGECTYYVNGGWVNEAMDMDVGWRFGTLPNDVMEELDKGLDLSRLEDLQDCRPDHGLFDVDAWVVSSAESSAICVSPGPKLSKTLAIIESRALALWSGGQQMTGAIRVSAVSSNDDSSIIYQWPLIEPLSDFVLEEDVPPNKYKGFAIGVSRLVSDAGYADKLRRLREQYIADRTASPGWFTDGQVMSDDSTFAFVYMRDALPYEDDHGLWPF